MAVNHNRRPAKAALCAVSAAVLALLCGACAAASRAPEAGRPRGTDAPYPVVLGTSVERRDQALAAWTALARGAGATDPPAPELQPVTATLGALPSSLNASLRLPQVGGGDGKAPTEEEWREALRRFIAAAAPLLGVMPSELSLVDRTDNPDGTKSARYQQNAFDLPLRGGFGHLEITYTTDRRVVALSSTAIPDTERLRRALAAARQQLPLSADHVTAALPGRVVTFAGPAGDAQSYTITPSDQLVVGELVIYPVRGVSTPSVLEFHLAWEVTVARPQGDALVVYVDAMRGEQLGTAARATHKS